MKFCIPLSKNAGEGSGAGGTGGEVEDKERVEG